MSKHSHRQTRISVVENPLVPKKLVAIPFGDIAHLRPDPAHPGAVLGAERVILVGSEVVNAARSSLGVKFAGTLTQVFADDRMKVTAANGSWIWQLHPAFLTVSAQPQEWYVGVWPHE